MFERPLLRNGSPLAARHGLRSACVAMALSLAGLAAHAATCEAKAAEKKLFGAAKTSFVKKCEKDLAGGPEACAGRAVEKKLVGAAKTSFVKKCEKDAKDNRDAKAG